MPELFAWVRHPLMRATAHWQAGVVSAFTAIGSEQAQVPATHPLEPILDEADGAAAEVMDPPSAAGRHALAPEQADGDLAVGRARQMGVERAKDQLAPAELVGAGRVHSRRLSVPRRPPKAEGYGHTLREERIERQ